MTYPKRVSDWMGYDADERPRAFIQWKGTDVCADYYCACGDKFHVDGRFAYVLKCPHCKRLYAAACFVNLLEISKSEAEDIGHIPLARDDEDTGG